MDRTNLIVYFLWMRSDLRRTINVLSHSLSPMTIPAALDNRHGDYAVPHLIGVAMLLSTAVQLRYGPIGIGEVAGIGAVGLSLLTGMRFRSYSVFFIGCASIICTAVFYGGVLSLFVLGQDFVWFDFVGMVYAFLVASALLVASDRSTAPLSSVAPYLLLLPIVQVMLFLYGFFLDDGLPIWFSEEGPIGGGLPLVSRFVGWATFPNQLGIAISGLPFVILLLRQLKSVSRRFSILAFICTIACALLIMSNTVFVSWILGVASVMYARGAFSIRFSSSRVVDIFLVITLLSLIVVTIVVIAILFAPDFFTFLFVKGDDEDLNGRLPLWIASLEAWVRSPLIGLGPGPHALVEGQGLAAESHLLALDILTQGGIVALLALLWIFVWAFSCAVKARNGVLIGLVVAVTVEALAHNTQRHPLFWFYLVLPAVIFHLGGGPHRRDGLAGR